MNIILKKLVAQGVIAVVGLVSFLPTTVIAGEEEPKADVIITFVSPPGDQEKSLVQATRGQLKHTFRRTPSIAASVPLSALEDLKKNSKVLKIEQDTLVTGTDAELDSSWGVKIINTSFAHAVGNTGTGVKVAVIDSGINYNHPELSAYYAGGYDFVNNDSDPMDDHGHGTHVAGIIAAADNNAGVVGVAPNVQLYALKVLGSNNVGSFSNIMAAVEWAIDNGMQITNNSYSGLANPGTAVSNTFAAAGAMGIFQAAAAGNTGNCAGTQDVTSYPAAYDSVVAIASVDSGLARSCSSGTGAKIELSAPGVTVLSTNLTDGYQFRSGTSMASPHVAGSAALLLASGIVDANGDGKVNDEIRERLNSTAKDLGAPGKDNLFGYGMLDIGQALGLVPDPAVTVTLSADKAVYQRYVDSHAILTVSVINELDSPISGLSSTNFTTTVNGSAIPLNFSATLPGTYTASLPISSYSTGNYLIEVTATDTRSIPGVGQTSFVLEPAPFPTISSVTSITYTKSGKNVLVKATVKNDFGQLLNNANLSLSVKLNGSNYKQFSGNTSSNGTVQFEVKNAPNGCYDSVVTQLTATSLTWDNITPSNSFCK